MTSVRNPRDLAKGLVASSKAAADGANFQSSGVALMVHGAGERRGSPARKATFFNFTSSAREFRYRACRHLRWSLQSADSRAAPFGRMSVGPVRETA